MSIIGETLSQLAVGEPAGHGSLTVFPLSSGEARTPDYLVLDEALERGLCRVTEVSEAGSVPELAFVNDSAHRILMLDGEELVGARQNRVLNISLLVGGRRKVVIPVSCVEQGRWAWRGRNFRSARRAMYARGRREKMAQVSASMRAHGSRRADQGAVWQGVAAMAANLDVASSTGAMADVYEHLEGSLAEYRARLGTRPGQNGAVFALGGDIAGLELFDAPETFARLFPKLLDSYAMDALEARTAGTDPHPSPEAVRDFLGRVGEARAEAFAALGEGRDLRLHGRRVVGGALECDGWLIHLSAFELPANRVGGDGWHGARVASLALRRRARGG